MNQFCSSLLFSVSRGVTAGFEAKALYTSERELLAGQIEENLRRLVEPRGIVIESTPPEEWACPSASRNLSKKNYALSRRASAWGSSWPRSDRSLSENGSRPKALLISRTS